MIRAVAAAAAVVFTACSDAPLGPGQSGTAVARLIIAPDSIALPRTQSMQLVAIVLDASGNELDGRDVAWSSSDPTRVTVASTGLITASEVGSSLVRATSEGKSDSVKIIVTP